VRLESSTGRTACEKQKKQLELDKKPAQRRDDKFTEVWVSATSNQNIPEAGTTPRSFCTRTCMLRYRIQRCLVGPTRLWKVWIRLAPTQPATAICPKLHLELMCTKRIDVGKSCLEPMQPTPVLVAPDSVLLGHRSAYDAPQARASSFPASEGIHDG
jgi:hypothetical protein